MSVLLLFLLAFALADSAQLYATEERQVLGYRHSLPEGWQKVTANPSSLAALQVLHVPPPQLSFVIYLHPKESEKTRASLEAALHKVHLINTIESFFFYI